MQGYDGRAPGHGIASCAVLPVLFQSSLPSGFGWSPLVAAGGHGEARRDAGAHMPIQLGGPKAWVMVEIPGARFEMTAAGG